MRTGGWLRKSPRTVAVVACWILLVQSRAAMGAGTSQAAADEPLTQTAHAAIPAPPERADTENAPADRADEKATTDDVKDRVAAQEAESDDWLADAGIELSLSYSADLFYNASGGLNTSDAEQYRGLAIAELTMDTEAMGLWDGGTLYVSMINNHGTDITARHVGDLQALNNADAPNDTRLYEFWYEQRFFDDKLRIKFGKIDANVEFAASEYGGEFVHSSPGFSPTIPMPTWPDPALGVTMFVEPVDWLYFGVGVFDAEGVGTRSGFETAFHSPDDVFTMFELGLRTKLSLFGQSALPGTYRLGGFYHSGQWPVFRSDLGGRLGPKFHRGNAGLYLVFDQMLFKEVAGDPEDEQGLGAFFQFSWVPSEYNEITQHYGWGFQYTGPIPNRDADVVGFGMHHVSLGSRVQSLERRFSETALELFYKWRVNEYVSVKPDVQYIVNPGGNGRNALVVGMRVEVAF